MGSVFKLMIFILLFSLLNPASASNININANKTISVNGVVTFPVGMYGMFYGSLGSFPASPDMTKDFLFRIPSCQKAWFDTQPLSGFSSSLPAFESSGTFLTATTTMASSMSSSDRNSAGFFGYMMPDEPDLPGTNNALTPAEIVSRYNTVKTYDKLHPVLLTVTQKYGGISSLWAYKDGADILMWDEYSVTNTPSAIDSAGTWPRADAPYAHEYRVKVQAFLNHNTEDFTKPIFEVVQAYGQNYNNMLDVMTPAEIRTMSYLPITMNVNGIVYYAFHTSSGSPDDGLYTNPTVLGYYKDQAKELHSINNILVMPTIGYSWYGKQDTSTVQLTSGTKTFQYSSSTSMPIQKMNYILKGDSTGKYLIIINKDSSAVNGVTVTIPSLSTVSGQITLVLNEVTVGGTAGRTLTMTNGKFTDNFAAKAVHVYKLVGNGGVDINSPPVISSWSNSKTNDASTTIAMVASESASFNIIANQNANINWYVNSTLVQSNVSANSAKYTNNSAKQGTWIVKATATNANGTVSKEWTLKVTSPPIPSAPIISNFAPVTSTVSDNIEVNRSFNINVDQIVNVNWYINGISVKSNADVTDANYINASAKQGTWVVKATATNANGTVSKEWTWTVSSSSTNKPTISLINPSPEDGAILARNYVYIDTSITNAATAFIDWNRSLIGWWRFNGESNENPSFFRDWSSWGNNGTCSGTTCPTSTSGMFGNALNFDGPNDYVDAGNAASLNITNAITIEAWVNPAVSQESCSGNYGIMSKASDSVNSVNWSWQLRYGAPGGSCYLGFQFNGNPEGGRWVTVKQNLIPGQWYHIVGTFNGTDIVSYLNGDLKDTNKISAIKGYNNKLLIGNEGWGNFFNGKIDEVRIFSRALSPDEIKATYNAGIYRLYNNFTNLPVGVYNYRVYAQDLSGNVNKTELKSMTLTPVSNSPIITSYAPVPLVSDIAGSIRSFDITVSQRANVNWYINGTPVQVNGSITGAMYTNTSASAGTWIVKATAINANGTVSREWIWTVTPISPAYPVYDVNEDGTVDIIDLTLVGQNINKIAGAPYRRCDVNEDGFVDVLDILKVSQHFGEKV